VNFDNFSTLAATPVKSYTRQLQCEEDSGIFLGIARLDCAAKRFKWEMTGENIYYIVLLEVSNEFSNPLKEFLL
jgi:hypothetical protein